MASMSLLSLKASEERAETARLSSFIGAVAIGDLVKSTLGPKGMDKILLSTGREGTVTVTNDEATILKAIGVDNPAAKVLVDTSKVQDDEVGDGTTSVTVLAAELLREAELLIVLWLLNVKILLELNVWLLLQEVKFTGGKTTYGLDMKKGAIADMGNLGVIESFQVKRQVLLSAAEAAEVILCVDDIIKAAPRKHVPHRYPC
ncbi:UNVERIFIED_CONTAM: hypothetical protein K2H54_056646 [Gekko kuhli]